MLKISFFVCLTFCFVFFLHSLFCRTIAIRPEMHRVGNVALTRSDSRYVASAERLSRGSITGRRDRDDKRTWAGVAMRLSFSLFFSLTSFRFPRRIRNRFQKHLQRQKPQGYIYNIPRRVFVHRCKSEI